MPDLPANYRDIVAVKVRETFFDPYSIRDAAISLPIHTSNPLTGTSQIVCVRANAKNRMGAYTGLKATSFIFRAGQLTMTDTDYSALTCANAAYEPFPELESTAAKPRR